MWSWSAADPGPEAVDRRDSGNAGSTTWSVLRRPADALALPPLEADPSVNAFIVAGPANAMAGMEICWEARLLASFERPLYICMICRSPCRRT